MELKDILLDRERGAAELVRQAAEWLQEHLDALAGPARTATLDLLCTTRPAMAGFTILARKLADSSLGSPADAVGKILSDLRTVEPRLAARFARLLSRESKTSLVTLSYSSSVLTALNVASPRLGAVHVMESLPGGEGRRLAAEAERFLPTVIVHADAEVELAATQADMAVVGADTVFADGAVLNKVLSARLAGEMARAGKPLYVLASTWKFADRPSAEHRLDPADTGMFEIVPARWITGIVTEEGLLVSGG